MTALLTSCHVSLWCLILATCCAELLRSKLPLRRAGRELLFVHSERDLGRDRVYRLRRNIHVPLVLLLVELPEALSKPLIACEVPQFGSALDDHGFGSIVVADNASRIRS